MVKDYLSWAETMIKTPVSDRKAWVKKIIEAFRYYRPTGKSDLKAEGQKKYLSDILESEDDIELIGFAANANYIKVDSSNSDELGALYVHPFGTPPLLYKHKKLPMLIIVGPGIRLDESVLAEATGNDRIPTRGITG
jgi:hypothetical protein